MVEVGKVEIFTVKRMGQAQRARFQSLLPSNIYGHSQFRALYASVLRLRQFKVRGSPSKIDSRVMLNYYYILNVSF